MVSPQPSPQDTIIHRGIDSIVRLASLDLSEPLVLDVVAVANAAHANTTEFHPKSAAGFYLWAEAVQGLRLKVVPEKWTPEDDRGYPVVVHPQRTHAIGVAGGNEHTGNPDANPRTKNEKGAASRDAVDRNQRSFWNIIPTFAGGPPPEPVAASHTWILLLYVDKTAEVVRAELSLPFAYDADGYIMSWRERIILPAVPYGAAALELPEGEGDDEQDFEVERRAS